MDTRIGAVPRRSILACALVPFGAGAAEPARIASLRGQYEALARGGSEGQVAQWLRVQSSDEGGEARGWIHAVLQAPFEAVSTGLASPAAWCELLNLHLNNKSCRVATTPGGTELVLRVTRLHSDPPDHAFRLPLAWQPPRADADLFEVRLAAADGPFGTSDYRIALEAIPLAAGRCFAAFQYAYRFNLAARLAMEVYLASVAREKVGFTLVRSGTGDLRHVTGMRGVVERNALRYFLAIEAWLRSAELPPARRFEARLEHWFEATERYPRQLHEIDRQGYLEMKRNEDRWFRAG